MSWELLAVCSTASEALAFSCARCTGREDVRPTIVDREAMSTCTPDMLRTLFIRSRKPCTDVQKSC